MKRFIFVIIVGCLLSVAFVLVIRKDSTEVEVEIKESKKVEVKIPPNIVCPVPERKSWPVQSIDTMKFSRDHARERLGDAVFMSSGIQEQVEQIAQTEATHVAIGTPYDKEFLPMMRRWVQVARQSNLKVFFRGNWSGWEGWFEYPKSLTRKQHLEKTKKFILENPSLFEDGDIFSACPECENGGPGDPRHNGDLQGHREFLVEMHKMMDSSFEEIGKDVESNNFSMNGDVAELVMDQKTTTALGGTISIDHYVATPEKLVADVDRLAKKSGGKVFIGELGAPISSVHGKMTEQQQAAWLEKALNLLRDNENVVGVNYWVNRRGSTALWDDDGGPLEGVEVISRNFLPNVISLKISDERGFPVANAQVDVIGQEHFADQNGCLALQLSNQENYESGSVKIQVRGSGFEQKEILGSGKIQKHEIELSRKLQTQ